MKRMDACCGRGTPLLDAVGRGGRRPLYEVCGWDRRIADAAQVADGCMPGNAPWATMVPTSNCTHNQNATFNTTRPGASQCEGCAPRTMRGNTPARCSPLRCCKARGGRWGAVEGSGGRQLKNLNQEDQRGLFKLLETGSTVLHSLHVCTPTLPRLSMQKMAPFT